MNFDAVLSYCLPTPVMSMKTWLRFYKVQISPAEEFKEKQARLDLISTALAIAGFFLASKYADRVGLSLAQAALLAVPVFPMSVRKAVGGYFVFSGIQGAISAAQVNNTADLAKNVGLAALGWFGNTVLITVMLNKVFRL